MIEVEVLILVIASRDPCYDKLISNYWRKLINYIKVKNLSVHVCLIFGKDSETNDLCIDDENILKMDSEESLIPGVLKKTIKAFEHANNSYNYKHLFRTNLSSFLLIDNLINISKSLSSSSLYAGVIGHGNFISGAGMWFSRDTINSIISSQNALNYKLIDDVAIAIILPKIKRTKLDRYDIIDENDKNLHVSTIINDLQQSNGYHIRLKHSDRNIDVKYATEFADYLYL